MFILRGHGHNPFPPFHLVVIDARGTVSVTRYGHEGVEQICSGPAKANRLRMIPPLIATVISSDGVGRSALCSHRLTRSQLRMRWLTTGKQFEP